jgi:hypothetical protein
MPEPLAFAGLIVAAISPLYGILKRHYDVTNANLASRLQLARELKDACEQWSTALERTFDTAVRLLDERGPIAARSEIERQQADFNALDYGSLARDGGALQGLRHDPRFESFAEACERFYGGAIELKRIAYGTFDEAGKARAFNTDGFTKVASLWKHDVEKLLNEVRLTFRGVERLHQT